MKIIVYGMGKLGEKKILDIKFSKRGYFDNTIIKSVMDKMSYLGNAIIW